MTADTVLRVSTPAELIAALPFVLGFHPADSVVVVGVRESRIVFAARHDLPPAGTTDAQFRAEADELAILVAGQQVGGAAVIGYGPAGRVTSTVLRMAGALGRVGLPVIEQLRVTDGRYWSLHCHNAGCCPKEGRECLPDNSAVAAAATYSGAVALPDREALIAQLAPVPVVAPSGPALARLEELSAGGRSFPAHVRRAGRLAVRAAELRYEQGGVLTDAEMAWLGVLLAQLPVRDFAWERTGTDSWWLALWTDVVRRVEPAYVPAPASLLAFAAWRGGNGPLARVAVERALEADPKYSLAGLVEEIVRLGLHPRALNTWPREKARAKAWQIDVPSPRRTPVHGRISHGRAI